MEPVTPLLTRNTPFEVRLTVTNRSRLADAVLFFPDERINRLQINAGETTAYLMTDRASHIGRFNLADRPIYVEDAFGLFRMPVCTLPQDALILPSLLALSPTEADGRLGMAARSTSRSGQDEFSYVEPHHPSAPMRRIHWKLSARMQKWMMRHLDEVTEPSATIFVIPPLESDDLSKEVTDILYDYAYTFSFHSIPKRVSLHLLSNNVQTLSVRLPLDHPATARRLLALDANVDKSERFHAISHYRDPQSTAVIIAAELSDDELSQVLSLRRRMLDVLLMIPDQAFTDEQTQRLHLPGLRVEPIEVIPHA